jgi:hypothetical protein
MTTSTLRKTIRGTRQLSSEDAGDIREWESLVDSASTPDVYYRPGYVSAYQAIGHGTATAVLVELDDLRALVPILLRPLNALPFAPDETGFDAATPYGYGGVLLLDGASSLNPDQSRELLQTFQDWCKESQVISAHLRLHPGFQQERWFGGDLGEGRELVLLGPTVALDLAGWNPATRSIATLNKGRRSDLNFARRHLRLTWTSDGRKRDEDLRAFYDLYEQRMTELEAGEYYHFDFEYYQSLAAGLDKRLDIAIAWLEDEAVGAAMFMTDRILSHYHLSASNQHGRTHKATTMILNSAAEHARDKGCQRLHLGGGARGEDKLFAFKESFGGYAYRYSCLSLICDPIRYRNLVNRRLNWPHLPAMRANFFPEYRA